MERRRAPRSARLTLKAPRTQRGSRETLGAALIDGALGLDGRSDGTREGDVEIEGASEGTPVGTLDVVGAENAEGSTETLGAALADGALEDVGRSAGAGDGAADVEGTPEGTFEGLEDDLGASETWRPRASVPTSAR